MTHTSSLLSAIKGVTQLLSLPQANFYNLGMLSKSVFKSYTTTFAAGENNILNTFVKYLKVGCHGISTPPLVYWHGIYTFSNNKGIMRSFHMMVSI